MAFFKAHPELMLIGMLFGTLMGCILWGLLWEEFKKWAAKDGCPCACHHLGPEYDPGAYEKAEKPYDVHRAHKDELGLVERARAKKKEIHYFHMVDEQDRNYFFHLLVEAYPDATVSRGTLKSGKHIIVCLGGPFDASPEPTEPYTIITESVH
jgi:hypothetical protein